METVSAMQKLYFQSAWDQTISPADREKIIHLFQEQTKHLESDVHFSFLWKATNHKGEQLITVLIHNTEDHPFRLENKAVSYFEQEKRIATGMFSLPCEIAGHTSMPWTFIFSDANQTDGVPQYTIM